VPSRDHRPKASEVFRNTNYVFATKLPFNEAFPEIEEIRVEVQETGYGTPNYMGVYDKRVGEFVDCSNSQCYNGGVSVGHIIREMVRERETDREASAICRGNEASPKGRRVYRKCLNQFSLKISLTYKTEQGG
jgi:hypothetical protein